MDTEKQLQTEYDNYTKNDSSRITLVLTLWEQHFFTECRPTSMDSPNESK